jgi:hypothetical protein
VGRVVRRQFFIECGPFAQTLITESIFSNASKRNSPTFFAVKNMQQYKNDWISGCTTPFSTYARGDVCTVESNGRTVVVKQFESREELPTREAAAAHGLMLAKAWVDQKEDLKMLLGFWRQVFGELPA